METDEFQVSFLKRAAVDLADNEKVSLWEPARLGTVGFHEDGIRLDGKWRMSAIGNVLGTGILGELLIQPFFLRDRSEIVSVQNLERVVIHERKADLVLWRKVVTFHLFQTRDQGMVEVHVFVVDNKTAPQVIDTIRTTVPANLLQERNTG